MTRPRTTTCGSIFVGIAAFAIGGCGGDEKPASNPNLPTPASVAPPWFVEEAVQRGIAFKHVSGHRPGVYRIPESIGGGAALFDMDGDGDLDAYLVQSGALEAPRDPSLTNRLYRNRGDGTFEDVTEGSGAGDGGYGMGAACGDYDNDGDVDVYVTNYGTNVLLRNDGRGVFTDVTETARVGDGSWGTAAVFADYDRDGDLDLYVCNYVNWSPTMEIECYNSMGALDYCLPVNYNAPGRDVLYRNDGDGSFTDVTEEAGIGAFIGTSLGVLASDFNGDGWIDFFVANDGARDQLWISQAGVGFKDMALPFGCAFDETGQAKAGMGVDSTDLDDDGDFDLIVCNLGGESDSVYINEGGRYFSDATARSGIGPLTRPFTRFGVGFFDFDQDGWLDLYEANGRVMRRSHTYSEDPYAEPNVLLRGVGPMQFEAALPGGGTAQPLIASSRGTAFGDVNGDGAIDVLIVNRDGPAHLLMNIAPDRGNAISLRLLDHGRDAYNAVITMTLGERLMTRQVRSNAGYLASNDPRIHVGLGQSGVIGDVTVKWVDGSMEAFGDLGISAGTVVTLRRGEGTPVLNKKP